MKRYNVEFFTKNFNYVGSQQLSEISVEYDYISPSENSVAIAKDTPCEVGNIISIRSLTDEELHCGIVTTISDKKYGKIVKFKSFLYLFDVDIVASQVTGSVENWIKDNLTELYVNSSDDFQNINGLNITVLSSTSGSIEYEPEKYLISFSEMLVYVLKKYNIKVDFELNFSHKRIECTIGRNDDSMRVIEADLSNVIDKTIEMKSDKDTSVNKLTIINTGEDGSGEIAVYYRENDGTITSNPASNKRIVPVIFKFATIQCSTDEFATQALDTATKELTLDEFDNFIELIMIENDEMIHPELYEIGQKTKIISNGTEYVSSLTGYKTNNGKIELMFGAIRLELTKILKRRLSK